MHPSSPPDDALEFLPRRKKSIANSSASQCGIPKLYINSTPCLVSRRNLNLTSNICSFYRISNSTGAYKHEDDKRIFYKSRRKHARWTEEENSNSWRLLAIDTTRFSLRLSKMWRPWMHSDEKGITACRGMPTKGTMQYLQAICKAMRPSCEELPCKKLQRALL